MPPRYSLLVSSTDTYADTWEPFFRLLRTFWHPLERVPIFLRSETLDFNIDGLDVQCTLTGRFFDRPPTWAESLYISLGQVETEYVLYVQDDYFLYSAVRTDVIDEAVQLMDKHCLAHVRLLDGSSLVVPGPDPLLESIERGTKYYISLQAGLWRTNLLKALLRRHENPWGFELYGSHRARRHKHQFTRLTKDRFHALESRVFPYELTGITKGLWEGSIVEPLFKAHGIEVDFGTRGFVNPESRPTLPKSPATVGKALRRVRSLI